MELPVEVRDTLTDPGDQRYDYIAGNPPWVNWRHLNAAYRARIAHLWEHYKLVPRGRLGGAMDDLSILFTYLCADRLLAPSGRMALVLSRTLFPICRRRTRLPPL
jgi:methylase of polypeptide subunit release factors